MPINAPGTGSGLLRPAIHIEAYGTPNWRSRYVPATVRTTVQKSGNRLGTDTSAGSLLQAGNEVKRSRHGDISFIAQWAIRPHSAAKRQLGPPPAGR